MRNALWIIYRVFGYVVICPLLLVTPIWVWVKIGAALLPSINNGALYGLLFVPIAVTYIAAWRWSDRALDRLDAIIRVALFEGARKDKA